MSPLPLRTKVTGDFLSKISDRIARWEGLKIRSVLQADDQVKWWYWQEHGTAGQGKKDGASYPIIPVNAETLAFPGPDGKTIFVSKVEHHGIKARRIVSKVMPDIAREAMANLAQAFAKGAADNPDILTEYIHEAADMARQIIIESIDLNLTGDRPDGRLHGRSPGAVFEDHTQIVDG